MASALAGLVGCAISSDDAGQQIEVEGAYIPGAVANAPDPSGRLDAVIHYTHAECGYTIIAGTRYNN